MNQYIDHTLLRPDASWADIRQLCAEAIQHRFYAVCVPPYYVARCRQELDGTAVKLATVVGFPYGYAETMNKIAEARRAMDEGADEIDFVINRAAVRSGDWGYVRSDIEHLVTAVRLKGRVSKVILEITELSDSERDQLLDLCNELRPDYVKTSTGLMGGARAEDLRYLRANLYKDIRLKASGGIRDRQQAVELIAAGADRLGTSRGISVVG